MTIINEVYQFLFISSIIFIMNILFNFLIKMYGRFKLGAETVFVLTKTEKIILWISFGIFFAYLI